MFLVSSSENISNYTACLGDSQTQQQFTHRQLTYEPPENYPVEAYKSIKDKLKEEQLSSLPSLYIEEENDSTRQEESVTGILGFGSCKRAVQLSGGRALLIPNMSVDWIYDIQSRWPKIVEEEIQMSKFLQTIGLLGSQLQKVKVFSETDAEECIPAYATDTFDSLKEKNIYIMDRKEKESNTWKGDHKLFENLQDTKKLDNWRPIIELLEKDIAKLVYYQLPVEGDSFNVAIVRGHDGDKIRYFGFDYTFKGSKTLIPITEKAPPQINKSQNNQLLSKINRALSNALEPVLVQEYKVSSWLPEEAWSTIEKLQDTYANDILKEVYALQDH